jgi:hypothetical protein
LALLQIAKVTEEAVEEAREKVMVRSGRIGHHLFLKQFIFEIIERAKSMAARDFAAVEVFGFEEMLVFVSSVFAAPPLPPASSVHGMNMRMVNSSSSSEDRRVRTNGDLSKERRLTVGGGDAAIHGYICTGHETRIVAGEKRNDAVEIGGHHLAPHGCSFRNRVSQAGSQGQPWTCCPPGREIPHNAGPVPLPP